MFLFNWHCMGFIKRSDAVKRLLLERKQTTISIQNVLHISCLISFDVYESLLSEERMFCSYFLHIGPICLQAYLLGIKSGGKVKSWPYQIRSLPLLHVRLILCMRGWSLSVRTCKHFSKKPEVILNKSLT